MRLAGLGGDQRGQVVDVPGDLALEGEQPVAAPARL
jgi:hypothetical protein